ncbi:MAG: silent information regulator protein Sir2, partial [Micromonosporaceae bacterium]|nr:silent information regulator protein Sir2 [Micromonosporaceae bacterium]
MEISRRSLLSLLPAAGLSTVFTPGRASADPGADRARLLANTVAIFAGAAGSNARPEVAAKLAAIDGTARTWLARMDAAGDGELFSGVPLGSSDPNLSASFRHLYEIALATRAPGGDLHGDADAQRRVVDGLVWLHEHYYGDQSAGYYGNWFHWEIGISAQVSKTLVLLADVVEPALVQTYVASMDAYLRNGKDGDVDLDSRFHTGANLADITTNRILQGALLGDDARIRKALGDQLTVFATIDPYQLKHGVTDGYYADGSFIQHHSVAYTGSYGKGLLTRVVQTLKILDGTGYANADALAPVVQRWVRDGFAPLIFEGWMMEIVKGRAVSRTTTGYADVAVVVEALVDLSDYAAGDDAAALKSYVKFIRSTSRAALNPTSFTSPVSIVRYADIIGDGSITPADLNPASRSVAFNAMDKNVHRRSGYAFALARSSDRISKYEYMNGENQMPWFQGDGAYYLYLSGQDQTQAFGVDYYTTVSPYGLAGVTAPVEQRKTISELYGTFYYDNPDHPLEFTPSSESQNTYVYFPRGTNRHSGGAVLGAYGAAGLVQSSDVGHAHKQEGLLPDDFVVYRNATATKSWFMLDDEIVVLAAGVGDPAGRAVTTTVDARAAVPSDQIAITGALRDGSAWSGAGSGDLRWLRYANRSQGTAVGYVFLDSPRVRVALEEVTRSRRVVRASNPDTMVTRNVFGVTIDHAAGAAPSSLAYALAPNAEEGQLRSYQNGPLTVLANNPRVQAVKHTGLGLTAANVFA